MTVLRKCCYPTQRGPEHQLPSPPTDSRKRAPNHERALQTAGDEDSRGKRGGGGGEDGEGKGQEALRDPMSR